MRCVHQEHCRASAWNWMLIKSNVTCHYSPYCSKDKNIVLPQTKVCYWWFEIQHMHNISVKVTSLHHQSETYSFQLLHTLNRQFYKVGIKCNFRRREFLSGWSFFGGQRSAPPYTWLFPWVRGSVVPWFRGCVLENLTGYRIYRRRVLSRPNMTLTSKAKLLVSMVRP